MNLAKRKGISLENFEIPKNDSLIKNFNENLNNRNNIMKNREILNALTTKEIFPFEKKEYINKYNLELENLQFPKIISNYKFGRIKIKSNKLFI